MYVFREKILLVVWAVVLKRIVVCVVDPFASEQPLCTLTEIVNHHRFARGNPVYELV